MASMSRAIRDPLPQLLATVHDRNIQLWVAAQQLRCEYRPAEPASNDQDRKRTIRAVVLRDRFPLEMRILNHPVRATLTSSRSSTRRLIATGWPNHIELNGLQ